jgi:hypothetical protein
VKRMMEKTAETWVVGKRMKKRRVETRMIEKGVIVKGMIREQCGKVEERGMVEEIRFHKS